MTKAWRCNLGHFGCGHEDYCGVCQDSACLVRSVDARVESMRRDDGKLMLDLDCGCSVKWESDPMIVPPTYRHDCNEDGGVGWSPDMLVPNGGPRD